MMEHKPTERELYEKAQIEKLTTLRNELRNRARNVATGKSDEIVVTLEEVDIILDAIHTKLHGLWHSGGIRRGMRL